MLNQSKKILPWIILFMVVFVSSESHGQFQWDSNGIKVASTTVTQVNVSAAQDSYVSQLNPSTTYGAATTMNQTAGWRPNPPEQFQEFVYVDFGSILASIPADVR